MRKIDRQFSLSSLSHSLFAYQMAKSCVRRMSRAGVVLVPPPAEEGGMFCDAGTGRPGDADSFGEIFATLSESGRGKEKKSLPLFSPFSRSSPVTPSEF